MGIMYRLTLQVSGRVITAILLMIVLLLGTLHLSSDATDLGVLHGTDHINTRCTDVCIAHTPSTGIVARSVDTIFPLHLISYFQTSSLQRFSYNSQTIPSIEFRAKPHNKKYLYHSVLQV